MDVLNSLRSLCEEVKEELPNINSGGCGLLSARVGKALEKQGIRAWGRAYANGGGWNPAWVARKLAKQEGPLNSCDPFTWEDNGFFFEHVATRMIYEGKVWQIDGIEGLTKPLSEVQHRQIQKGILTIREIESMSKVRAFWNPSFNRREGLPIINRLVRKHLEAA